MSTADQLISNFRNDKAIPTYFCLQFISDRPKSFEIFQRKKELELEAVINVCKQHADAI